MITVSTLFDNSFRMHTSIGISRRASLRASGNHTLYRLLYIYIYTIKYILAIATWTGKTRQGAIAGR